jgi:hypothetical protein
MHMLLQQFLRSGFVEHVEQSLKVTQQILAVFLGNKIPETIDSR